MGESASAVDRALNLMGGLSLALLLMAFLVGVQGARARRADGPAPRSRSWLPRLRARDVAAPLVLYLALLPLPYVAAAHVSAIGKLADAPLELFQDGLASPGVEPWLENLAASEARGELLSIARGEREAVMAGDDRRQGADR